MTIHSAQELTACPKDRRKQCKLSQAEVADRGGLRQKTVSTFENKPDNTKLDTFLRIVSALDLQIQVVQKERPEDCC
jgi:HTH-type transcriptional regulator / antitoxin HipB